MFNLEANKENGGRVRRPDKIYDSPKEMARGRHHDIQRWSRKT